MGWKGLFVGIRRSSCWQLEIRNWVLGNRRFTSVIRGLKKNFLLPFSWRTSPYPPSKGEFMSADLHIMSNLAGAYSPLEGGGGMFLHRCWHLNFFLTPLTRNWELDSSDLNTRSLPNTKSQITDVNLRFPNSQPLFHSTNNPIGSLQSLIRLLEP